MDGLLRLSDTNPGSLVHGGGSFGGLGDASAATLVGEAGETARSEATQAALRAVLSLKSDLNRVDPERTLLAAWTAALLLMIACSTDAPAAIRCPG